MSEDRILIIRLDTDDVDEIRKFKERWEKLEVDVAFVPKSVKFRVEGESGDG